MFDTRIARGWRWLALAVSVGLVGLATLHSEPTSDPKISILRGADIVANLLLTLPVGLALRGLGLSLVRCLLIGAALSSTVETIQFVLPGRFPSIDDVITNTIGVGLGCFAGEAVSRWRGRGPVALRLVCLLAPAFTVWLSFQLAHPDLPPPEWHTQWTAKWGHVGHYDGTVQSASLGGIALPHGPVEQEEAVRAGLLGGEALKVRFKRGTRPERFSPLMSIRSERRKLVVILGVHKDDLVLRYRTRAAGFRFASLPARWEGVLAGQTGDSVDISARLDGSTWHVQVDGQETVLPPQAGRVWAAIHAARWTEYILDVIDFFWWMALLMPVAVFSRRTVLEPLAAVLGVVGLTAALSMAWPGGGCIFGAVVGLAIGARIRRGRTVKGGVVTAAPVRPGFETTRRPEGAGG